MDLRTKIDEKYKTAFKSKKTEEINALRLIRSAIKDKDIENRTIGNNELINDQQMRNNYCFKYRCKRLNFINLNKKDNEYE